MKYSKESIKYLTQNNIAFRGSNRKLYEPNNGKILGPIEMMTTVDPVMQEHLRQIRLFEIYDHYLGPNIQNELIKLLSEKGKDKKITDIKIAKYFSVLLGCTLLLMILSRSFAKEDRTEMGLHEFKSSLFHWVSAVGQLGQFSMFQSG